MSAAESITGLLAGTSTLLVGVEDHGDEFRIYLGHRARGMYAVIDDPDAQQHIRASWALARGHITVPVPPADCIFSESEPAPAPSLNTENTDGTN